MSRESQKNIVFIGSNTKRVGHMFEEFNDYLTQNNISGKLTDYVLVPNLTAWMAHHEGVSGQNKSFPALIVIHASNEANYKKLINYANKMSNVQVRILSDDEESNHDTFNIIADFIEEDNVEHISEEDKTSPLSSKLCFALMGAVGVAGFGFMIAAIALSLPLTVAGGLFALGGIGVVSSLGFFFEKYGCDSPQHFPGTAPINVPSLK